MCTNYKTKFYFWEVLTSVLFKRDALNRCELLEEISVIITVYPGLFFQLEFLSAWVQMVLLALIIITNLAFLQYIVRIMLKSKIRRLFL